MDVLRQLQTIWHRDIPPAAAMGIEVLTWQDGELRVGAALAANVNVHGTAFAGSLYSVCALAGWGSIWLELRAREIKAAIVLSRGEIDYLRPVSEDVVGACGIAAGQFDRQTAELSLTGRAKLTVTGRILTQRGKAAGFSGIYAVRVR